MDAMEAFNEFQLMRELHWTWADLMDAPEEVVWLATTVLSLEAQKSAEDERERQAEADANRRLGIRR